MLKCCYVQIAVIALYLAYKNVPLYIAAGLSAAIVVGPKLLAGKSITETFSVYSDKYEIATTATLIESKNAIYPGCLKATLADLDKAFDGDAHKLQTTVKYAFSELMKTSVGQPSRDRLMKLAYAAGLPFNVKITDENAPFIATILVQWGFDFGSGCAIA